MSWAISAFQALEDINAASVHWHSDRPWSSGALPCNILLWDFGAKMWWIEGKRSDMGSLEDSLRVSWSWGPYLEPRAAGCCACLSVSLSRVTPSCLHGCSAIVRCGCPSVGGPWETHKAGVHLGFQTPDTFSLHWEVDKNSVFTSHLSGDSFPF